MSGNAFTSATSLGASSIQDYGTPREFLDVVETLLGPIVLDLAARADNTVAPRWFGPGSPGGADSLAVPWHEIPGLLWLNPPFAESKRWAAKCAREASLGAKIALLVPANIGAAWFWDHVFPHAHVLALYPRIAFVGAPWRAWHKAAPKGSIAVPAELQDEASIRAWLGPAYDGARIARLPFPGALMLAVYGFGDVGQIERLSWRAP